MDEGLGSDRIDVSGSGCSDEAFAALVRDPGARSATTLVLDNTPVSAVALRSLAAPDVLPRLAVLSLRGCAVGDEGVRLLAELDRPLRELYLDDTGITDDGVAALLSAAWLPDLEVLTLVADRNRAMVYNLGEAVANAPFGALRYLDLSGRLLARQDVSALAGASNLAAVTELSLNRASLMDDDVRALAQAPIFTGLVRLSLAYNRLSSQGAVIVANSPGLGGLRFLDVTWNHLGDDGVSALVRSTRLGSLETLRTNPPQAIPVWAAIHARFPRQDLPEWVRVALTDSPQVVSAQLDRQAGTGVLSLERVRIGERARAVLVADARLADLHTVRLAGNGLGDEGARALAGCPRLAGVRNLAVTDNGLGAGGSRALAGSPYLRDLVALDLSGNPMGADSIAALADGTLPRLRELVLRGIGSHAGLDALLRIPNLAQLTLLDLRDNDISDVLRTYNDWSGMEVYSIDPEPACAALRERLGDRLRL